MKKAQKIGAWMRTIVVGMVVGLANVIPGISGGTMAVIMGIYPQMLSLMSVDWKVIRKQLSFYILLVAGIGIGILVFSQGITYLLDNHPMPTNYFFIGVIIGSLPMLWRRATDGGGLRLSAVIPCVLAFGLMLVMALIQTPESNQAYISALTFSSFVRVFLGGVVAAIAMIIPGISGSLLLIIMGLYATVIGAVSDFAKMLPVWLGLREISAAGDRAIFIIPAALGILVGLIIGGRLVSWLLKRYPRIAYGAIFGLVAGSPFAIYPGFAFNGTGLAAVVCLLIGVGMTLLLGREKTA